MYHYNAEWKEKLTAYINQNVRYSNKKTVIFVHYKPAFIQVFVQHENSQSFTTILFKIKCTKRHLFKMSITNTGVLHLQFIVHKNMKIIYQYQYSDLQCFKKHIAVWQIEFWNWKFKSVYNTLQYNQEHKLCIRQTLSFIKRKLQHAFTMTTFLVF